MSKPQRFIALMAAVLFLVTSVGFSIMVVIQMRNSNNKSNQAQQASQVLDEQNKGGLAGTKLQGFTSVSKVDSLQKIDITLGTGAEVKAGAKVTAQYTGALAKDGIVFESSLDSGQPATFPLSGVIKGWQEGVPGMKVGGKRRLLIPASLGYGEQGNPPKIGPNEPLVFDIEIVSVE